MSVSPKRRAPIATKSRAVVTWLPSVSHAAQLAAKASHEFAMRRPRPPESLARHGKAVLETEPRAQPKAGRFVVRIYYTSADGEILCCDSEPISLGQASALVTRTIGLGYCDAPTWAIGAENIPAHLASERTPNHGARRVVLPSQGLAPVLVEQPSLENLSAELVTVEAEIDAAYWRFSRQARAKPCALAVPRAYERRAEIREQMREIKAGKAT